MRHVLPFVLVLGGRALACAAEGETKPFLSLEHGLASDSPWLKPGKVDLIYRYREDENYYNAFLWTPTFKGGGGVINPEVGDSTTYVGGFLRPLAGIRDKGDLILMAQGIDAPGRRDYEAQAEYRLPMGLGVGGGFLEATEAGTDIAFGKLTYRNRLGDWSYILAALGQTVEGEASPGGYAALYNDQVMGVFGHDGEQWRVTGGYVAPTNETIFRPAAEVIYVDNDIGDFAGARSVFANATLRLQGGFLTHPVRLGRAMGPQGLEFGNPFGFIIPTWNRRLETWEIGGLLDLRYERIWLPNNTQTDRFDGALFPFQFWNERTVLDYVFVGGSYTATPAINSPGVIGGIFGRAAFLNVNVGVEQRFDPGETIVVLGLIDSF